jgi:hypothetical protein
MLNITYERRALWSCRVVKLLIRTAVGLSESKRQQSVSVCFVMHDSMNM